MISASRFVRLARGTAWAAVFAGAFAPTLLAQTPALPAADPGRAQAPASADQQQVREEVERLRKEFEAIRDSYGARLAALEAKLGTLPAPGEPPPAQAAQPTATPPVTALPEPPPALAPTAATALQPAEPTIGAQVTSSKVFNPDMAVIGNFLGAAGTNTVNPTPALDMHEAEATFQAVVDPYARGDFFLSFSPDGVELEEGFITLTALPGGLLAKAGKMKEQFGKVNTMHPHALAWTDKPLVMQNLLGGDDGLSDSGVSVSKLLLNPWFYLEATGELFQGTSGPFLAHERSDVSWLGRLRGYRDLTEGTNLDVGASFTQGHNDASADSRTRLFGIDATFRYRPLQRAIYRRFLARTELVWSHREQPDSTGGLQSSFGYYASADYQFARRWFSGIRWDSSDRAADSTQRDKGISAVLTFWPSEFSQVRGQYRHTRYAEGVNANEVLFQLLFSIGAHGAHVF